MAQAGELVVEALGADLVTLARCYALDAAVFPHPSLPALFDTSEGPPRIWVARAGEALAGHVGALRDGSRLHIVGLAVAPEHRRSGVGRALLRAVIASALERDVAHVKLHVSTTNAAAFSLYESEGFVVRRRLRRFYSPAAFGDGGDAFEMALSLADRRVD